jgi:hypothetical protein
MWKERESGRATGKPVSKEVRMSPLLLILILLLVFGGGGGYYALGPRGGMGIGGILFVVLIVMLLTGRL